MTQTSTRLNLQPSGAGGTGAALDELGVVEKALLNAIDQIQNYVAASLVGPDGKPLGTALYMHMPMGYAIDPDDFFNPWTPMGGDAAQYEDLDGKVIVPPPPAASATTSSTDSSAPSTPGTTPSTPSTAPSADSVMLEAAITSAFNTCTLVDDMLMVTDKGVAVAWPSMTVSVQWQTIIKAATPGNVGTVDPTEQHNVEDAYKLLWNDDGQGNVYPTALYQTYQNNQTAYSNAVANYAGAYATAMSNPAQGTAWPVESAAYGNTVRQALDNWNSEGRQKVEAALATINSQGQDSIATLISMANDTMLTWTVSLGGQVAANVPWSYITPSHWWDHMDESLGAQQLTASNAAYDAAASSETNSFSSQWATAASSSDSGGAGVDVGLWGASANVSHSQGASAFGTNASQMSSSHSASSARSATVTAEYFIATIHRPWMLADLLHVLNWYGFGWKKNQISDGTVTGQITPENLNSDAPGGDKIMPMIPKGFVIMRNVAIQADDWGDAGQALMQAQQQASGSAASQSTNVGVSAHYLVASGNYNHHDQSSQSSGSSGLRTGWSYQFDSGGKGGTLTMHGTQIIGWIGEVMPASPPLDAPPANTATPSSSTSSTSTSGTDGTTASKGN